MIEDSINRKQLIERYVLGQLSDEEEIVFETYYLSDPECIEQIEAAKRIQLGMRELSSATQHVSHPFFVQLRAGLQMLEEKLVVRGWAAATLVLCALLPWGMTLQDDTINAPQALGVIVFELNNDYDSGVRGNADETSFSAPPTDSRAVLSLTLNAEDIVDSSYILELTKLNAEPDEKEYYALIDHNKVTFDLGVNMITKAKYVYHIYKTENKTKNHILIKTGKINIK